MPIFVALAALAALIWGAVWSFDAIQGRFGLPVALAAAAAVLVAIALAVHAWLRRRRDIAPNVADGVWTHRLDAHGARVRLSAPQRLMSLDVGGEHGELIFADLAESAVRRMGDAWTVVLKVRVAAHAGTRGSKRAEWVIPVPDEREAKRWSRIFTLAMEQRL
jgi:hypothetical protein